MRTATYQVIPEKHGRGVFIYGKETTLYIQGSEEAGKEKLVWLGIDHTEAV